MMDERTDDPIATPIPKEVPQPDAPSEEPDTSLPIEMMEDKPDKDDLFEDGNFPL